MDRHFSLIGENQKIGHDEIIPEEKKSSKSAGVDLKMPITELKLTTRVLNGLISKKIETLSDLLKITREDLEEIRNLGKKSIEEIDEALKKAGYSLKTKEGISEKEVEK